jgi:hypothetical protein
MNKAKSFSIAAIVTLFLTVCFTGLQAQRIELSPFIGYETGSTIYTSAGYLYVGDGMDFGGNLDINLGSNRYAEISYSHMTTKLNVDEGYNERYLFDLGVNYYSAGILQAFKPERTISPYGLLTLGLVNFNPKTEDISGENKMHVSLAGGIKIKTGDRIGFKFQARLLMPIIYAGTNFNTGTGGASTHISTTGVAFQGDFTAAVIFLIK